MDAAQRLFLRHGIADTTIEQITRGADVAKGTFYLHFSSKEDVLLALRRSYVEGHAAGIRNAVEACAADDWEGRLKAWVRAAIAGYLDAMPLHDLVFREFSTRTEEDHGGDTLLDHLAALLTAGNAAGAWSVAEPRFAAGFLFHGLHGAIEEARHAARINRPRLNRACERLAVQLVGAAADAAD